MRPGIAGALLWIGCLQGATAQEAPFGLEWGPVTTVPRPSKVDREANITALVYFHGRAPASGSDTEEVVLEVCRDEGLQQVIWLSRPLSEAELPSRYDAIYREGVRRHGQPLSAGAPGMVVWPGERILLAVGGGAPGERRLAMVSRGDRYAACSDAHEFATGHPAGLHASRLLDPRKEGSP